MRGSTGYSMSQGNSGPVVPPSSGGLTVPAGLISIKAPAINCVSPDTGLCIQPFVRVIYSAPR